jgi:glycosyltransferase involved in cell wall biosynthesis/predicted O-methyltransferase YrrM
VTAWARRDYVSPGLAAVHPDAAFAGVRPRDQAEHPWRYLRRDVPHTWYADDRDPLMGVLNRDEAVLLHNIALTFAGRRALEIGSWIGWSTAHLALGGVTVDAIEPAHEDADVRAAVEASLRACGVADRVRLAGGASPGTIAELAAQGGPWSLFFVDGDHDCAAPTRDALACLPFATSDCAFVFHDVASPDVADALRALEAEGFEIVLYQTAQIMGMAWRGDVQPVAHVPDQDVAWQIPAHLAGLRFMGLDAPAPRPAAERSLRSLERTATATATVAARPTVCVVSNEILGAFRNGGIGTSMTGLAETLASEGFDVTILYTGSVWTPDVDIAPWRAHYAARAITLDTLDFAQLGVLQGPVRDAGFATPWLVHRYLSARAFDVVHVNDCCGDGSLALAAKALGIAYCDALFVLALHSPSQWVLELNEVLPTSLLLTAYNYAERLSTRCADVVWSPSRYMIGWARDHDFALPSRTFVQQYSLPDAARLPEVAYGARRAPREIVFFGRLEERKGLRLFCNALQLIADELVARDVSVTFLGKVQFCGGLAADEYIRRRAADWRFAVSLRTELGQDEALTYLRGGDRLAVMPSPQDNSPCTVYEALGWGIPFLAARTGGIPELLADEDAEHVLFEYTSEALRDALQRVLEHGGRVARPAVAQHESRSALVALHERWSQLRPEPAGAPEPRRWAAAVVDHQDGDDLPATLASLAACTWIREVLVLDRAGAAPGGDHRVDLTREDATAAVHAILSLAGDDLLLVHSGITVLPEQLSTMLGALSGSTVDGLLPAARAYDERGGARVVVPLGGSPAFCLFEGVTFTGAMLVTRTAVAAALRTHPPASDSPFLGLADFCVTDGEVWPFPEVVVEFPAGAAVRMRNALPARVGAYEEASAVDRYYMLAQGYGARSGDRSGAAGRRTLALALVDLGLAPGVRLASWTLRRARAIRGRHMSATGRSRLRS